MTRPARLAVAAILVALGTLALGTRGMAAGEDTARERSARHALQDARGLLEEGRLSAAERVLRGGLTGSPDDAALHRTLARVLDAQGRSEEAAAHRTRADALVPPLPALPDAPIDARLPTAVLVLPPAPDAELPDLPAPGELEAVILARARTRLPAGRAERARDASVAAARDTLNRLDVRLVVSARLERVYCGWTVKDGSFGVARLRVAAANPSRVRIFPRSQRVVVDDPSDPERCEADVVARAFETLLADPELAAALAESPDQATGSWTRDSLRAVFPTIEVNVLEKIRKGRLLLSAGRLEQAMSAFEGALAADPGDPYAAAFRDETHAALEITGQLASRHPPGRSRPVGALDPRLTDAQRASAELAIAEERQRRRQLLTALAVLDEDVVVPSPLALAGLRSMAIRDPAAVGPRLAREHAGGPIESRAAYAPDGSVIAVYYFAAGSERPLVREEDMDRNGTADRWVVYDAAARSEMFEDAEGVGRPDVRFVFARGGEPLLRVEVGLDAQARPERIFRYRDGALRAEESDTDGDGVLDRFDGFDAAGQVGVRAEDLDGDGDIDVRSVFQSGKLVRREILDPALADD